MKTRNAVMCLVLALTLSSCLDKNAKEAAVSEVVPAPDTKAAQAVKPVSAVKWVYNLNDAFAASKKEGKPVMADFYAEWCGWCKKLDREVYSDPGIIALSEKCVNAKIDTDKFGEDAQKYGVSGLPTIIFFKSDGAVLETVVGYRDKDAFSGIMAEVLKNAGSK